MITSTDQAVTRQPAELITSAILLSDRPTAAAVGALLSDQLEVLYFAAKAEAPALAAYVARLQELAEALGDLHGRELTAAREGATPAPTQ